MYYLNDKHTAYEYVIYCRKSKATPYLIGSIFDNERQVKQFIEEIGKRHERFNQPYYVDNYFYKNTYPITQDGWYYKILKRPVNDWQEIA